ncbi:hypothetical protein [Weissella paramesenteroides]|uniref:hypothetical protein n=1 Tax=Weissella paramesenteroides TaxID=1249 RepID=UPI0023FA26A2|nr:hypothetical protein [Weissella paramesenteroides]MDF8373623.1 hypothetical protein [Weissella paramesenteroides]WIG66608.1 hypothetical protein G9U56_06525 [Weissella paramesenteroides]
MADYDIGSTGVGNLHHGFSKSKDLVKLPVSNESQLKNGYVTLSRKKENAMAKSRKHDKKIHQKWEANYKTFKSYRDQQPDARGNELKELYKKVSEQTGISPYTLKGLMYEYKWRAEQGV